VAAEIFSKISGATLSQGRATYHITIWQIMFLYIKVHTGHIRKDVLKHITIDTFVCLYVLDFDLKCLSAERLAVEPHIVEVCACIIDYFQAISRCLVTAKAHSQSVAEVDEVVASGHNHKPLSSDLL